METKPVEPEQLLTEGVARVSSGMNEVSESSQECDRLEPKFGYLEAPEHRRVHPLAGGLMRASDPLGELPEPLHRMATEMGAARIAATTAEL